MKITLLNTSILTAFGTFEFQPLSLAEARRLVSENEFESAIGHQSTADILTRLLGVEVAANRVEYIQQAGETAIIFKLRARPSEGEILNAEQLEKVGYDFGILRRLKK